jgi:hypothetical protein
VEVSFGDLNFIDDVSSAVLDFGSYETRAGKFVFCNFSRLQWRRSTKKCDSFVRRCAEP